MKKIPLLFSSMLLLSACQTVNIPAAITPTQTPVVNNSEAKKPEITSIKITPEKAEEKKPSTTTEVVPVSKEVVAPANVVKVGEFDYPGYPLKFDTKKADVNVKKVQTRLNKIGYSLVVDGVFGQNTLDAVKYIQEQNDLKQDGIVGPKTWDALFNNTIAVDPNSDNYGDY